MLAAGVRAVLMIELALMPYRNSTKFRSSPERTLPTPDLANRRSCLSYPLGLFMDQELFSESSLNELLYL